MKVFAIALLVLGVMAASVMTQGAGEGAVTKKPKRLTIRDRLDMAAAEALKNNENYKKVNAKRIQIENEIETALKEAKEAAVMKAKELQATADAEIARVKETGAADVDTTEVKQLKTDIIKDGLGEAEKKAIKDVANGEVDAARAALTGATAAITKADNLEATTAPQLVAGAEIYKAEVATAVQDVKTLKSNRDKLTSEHEVKINEAAIRLLGVATDDVKVVIMSKADKFEEKIVKHTANITAVAAGYGQITIEDLKGEVVTEEGKVTKLKGEVDNITPVTLTEEQLKTIVTQEVAKLNIEGTVTAQAGITVGLLDAELAEISKGNNDRLDALTVLYNTQESLANPLIESIDSFVNKVNGGGVAELKAEFEEKKGKVEQDIKHQETFYNNNLMAPLSLSLAKLEKVKTDVDEKMKSAKQTADSDKQAFDQKLNVEYDKIVKVSDSQTISKDISFGILQEVILLSGKFDSLNREVQQFQVNGIKHAKAIKALNTRVAALPDKTTS